MAVLVLLQCGPAVHLNRLLRAVVQARQAQRAVIGHNGLIVRQFNISLRTYLSAYTAAYALIGIDVRQSTFI